MEDSNWTILCSELLGVISVPQEVIAYIIMDGVLFLVIVGGNLVTLYVLHSSFQYSHLVSNHFVLSLALSDTLVGCTLPYHIAFYLAPHLGQCKATCLLRFMLILLACMSSIINVGAIAVDRYLAIMHPFKYERIMTNRMAHTVLGIGWIHAVVVSTVPLYWNDWHHDIPCQLGRVLPRYYTAIVILPAFLLVWAVMLFIYYRIWREARQQAHRIRIITNINQLKRSCLQVVLIILGCFTICWLPFLAVLCTQSVVQYPVSPFVYRGALTLAFSSSAVNPVIYAWKNKEFKRTFGHLVRCRTASHSMQNDRSSNTDRIPQLSSTPRSSLLQESQGNTAATLNQQSPTTMIQLQPLIEQSND